MKKSTLSLKDRVAIANYFEAVRERYITDFKLTGMSLCDELRETTGIAASNSQIYQISRALGCDWVREIAQRKKRKTRNSAHDIRYISKLLTHIIGELDSLRFELRNNSPMFTKERLEKLNTLADRLK